MVLEDTPFYPEGGGQSGDKGKLVFNNNSEIIITDTKKENGKILHFSKKPNFDISSNVTARGIDIQQVSTVVNFDVPKCVHTYLHRIGRSGRWGRKGLGINFVTRRDVPKIKSIEQHYNTQIEELPKNFSDQLK